MQEDFVKQKQAEELDLHNQRIKLLKEEIAFHDDYSKRKQNEVKEELEGRHAELLEKIEEAEKRLVDLKDINDLAGEKAYLERTRDDLIKRVNQQKSIFEGQKDLLKEDALRKAAIEFETVRTVLNGITTEQKNELKPANLKRYENYISEEGRKRYIRDLRNSLNDAEGREFDYDETANLLLSTLQSYIIILAGAPGTGKTSTVLNFSDAMGLRQKDKKPSETDNLLNISIGRGWTSSRDLLGFYNSLKNTYQPSRSGLYEFLKAFSGSNTHLEQHLKLVLMDEANLSSIEHYWSDFLGWCDAIDKQHTLNLAPNSLLIVPKSLRFMATINNDATVESLSPRLIDRAAIIKLNHKDDSKIKDIQTSILSGAVPYEDLMKAFYPKNDDAELSDIEDYQLKEILNILSATQLIKGSPIYYSQRKINAITKYCYIANQLDFKETEPLDFAISQHILPSISGHGEDLKKRLESLKALLNSYGYSMSEKIVTEILSAGDDLSHSYSFF
jgi:DNA polymerase III delta prime subunit